MKSKILSLYQKKCLIKCLESLRIYCENSNCEKCIFYDTVKYNGCAFKFYTPVYYDVLEKKLTDVDKDV